MAVVVALVGDVICLWCCSVCKITRNPRVFPKLWKKLGSEEHP